MANLVLYARQLTKPLTQEKHDWRIPRPFRSILLLIILLALMPASMQAESVNAPAQANGDCLNGVNCTYTGAAEQSEFIEYVNTLRAQFGIPELKANSVLMLAARMQAAYLVSNNLPMSHAGGSTYGYTVIDRVEKASANYTNGALGENLTDTVVPQAAFESWTSSFPHCRTMVNPNYVDVGFAGVTNTDSDAVMGASVYGGPTEIDAVPEAISYCCLHSDPMNDAVEYASTVQSNSAYEDHAQQCLTVDGIGGYAMPQGIKDVLSGAATVEDILAAATGGAISATNEAIIAELNRRLQAEGLPLLSVNLSIQNYMENLIDTGKAADAQGLSDLLASGLKFTGDTYPELPYTDDPTSFWEPYYDFFKDWASGHTGAMVLVSGNVFMITVTADKADAFPADYAPLPK